MGIIYSPIQKEIQQNSNLFYGYADAAYANTDDYKSTSSYVFVVGGGAITWRSKKWTTIALSSTEAEYIALSEAGREACWLRNLYEELGYPQNSPNIIKGDNEGSISMVKKNPQFHKRAKHIVTRWHWVRDLVQNEIISIESCRDPKQTADVLTKPLAWPKHQKHLIEMGMITIWMGVLGDNRSLISNIYLDILRVYKTTYDYLYETFLSIHNHHLRLPQSWTTI